MINSCVAGKPKQCCQLICWAPPPVMPVHSPMWPPWMRTRCAPHWALWATHNPHQPAPLHSLPPHPGTSQVREQKLQNSFPYQYFVCHGNILLILTKVTAKLVSTADGITNVSSEPTAIIGVVCRPIILSLSTCRSDGRYPVLRSPASSHARRGGSSGRHLTRCHHTETRALPTDVHLPCSSCYRQCLHPHIFPLHICRAISARVDHWWWARRILCSDFQTAFCTSEYWKLQLNKFGSEWDFGGCTATRRHPRRGRLGAGWQNTSKFMNYENYVKSLTLVKQISKWIFVDEVCPEIMCSNLLVLSWTMLDFHCWSDGFYHVHNFSGWTWARPGEW